MGIKLSPLRCGNMRSGVAPKKYKSIGRREKAMAARHRSMILLMRNESASPDGPERERIAMTIAAKPTNEIAIWAIV
jgi:hypothetical protein